MPAALVVGYTVLWAGLCDLLLEGSLRVGHSSTWTPAVTVGILFVWCAVLFLLGLTGRLRFAFAISLALVAVLAAANLAKLSFLAEPLVPADAAYLRTPGFLVAMVSPRTVAAAGAAIVLLIVAVLVVGARLGRRYEPVRRGSAGWRRWTGLRILLVLGCGALLLQAGSFNRPGNLWRAAYESTDVTWAHWNQLENYQFNGFVGGALYNLPSVVMEEPAGYGPATMAQIADRYRPVTAEQGDRPDPNVVIVLSESFADPLALDGLTLTEDPLPRTRAASKDAWAGTALASFYGTGTSAMEFQALSGQSLALFEPQITTPYQQFLPGLDDYPTAVGWLGERGYRTVAIHPYSTQMYQRPEVYRVFGFDDFVHDTGLEEVGRIDDSPFISDRSAYHEVVHQIQDSPAPVLAHLVTMQNHVPMGGSYPDPIPVEGPAVGAEADEVAAWARGLSHTDAELPRLLDALRDSGEPTVVVFFGDHFPGIFGDRVRAANPGLALLETPFLIWSTEHGPARDLGVTAPTAFLPLAMERAGVPLPPYYELLRRVAEEVGALRGDGVVRPDGREVGYGNLSEAQAALVRDLRLAQYDLSVGRRYAVEDLWYSPEASPEA